MKKKKYKPVIKPRDLNVIEMGKKKQGAHKDKKREENKNACRKTIDKTE